MSDDVAARPASSEPPSAPDTKDWTWVLQRPCPDCGFDTKDYPGVTVPAVLHAANERWSNLLARTGRRTGRSSAIPAERPRARR